jgi:hypothetical protein
MPGDHQDISDLRKEIAEYEEDLRAKIDLFVSQVARSIQVQSSDIVKTIGQSQPDVTVKVGQAQLESLKKSVREYNAESLEICNKYLCVPSAWTIFENKSSTIPVRLHSRESFLLSFPGLPKEEMLPDRLNFQNIIQHIFDALAPLGEIMARLGYETDRDSRQAPHRKVCELYIFSSDLLNSLKECRMIEARIGRTKAKICAIEKENIKTQSDSFWDNFS